MCDQGARNTHNGAIGLRPRTGRGNAVLHEHKENAFHWAAPECRCSTMAHAVHA